MIYRIQEHPAFSVIGQEIVMTNYQRENIQISKQFWNQFNANLKKSYLTQSGNWTKYAFMERRDGALYYYCAIPKKAVIPESFILKEVKAHNYLVVQHIGGSGST
ncbi:MAG: GyrI-like domain-containing protein [Lachnospiraceae bacterium]|nr:GyrI-like domain-containing protein [Lachnospiraceae bacterium]